MLKSIAAAALIILIAAPGAQAGRAERSAENRAKAEAWCEDYLAARPGAECRVMRMGGLCPKGMRAGKRYNRIRANGYKTCVAGNKFTNFIKDIHDPRKATDLGLRGIRESTRGTVIIHGGDGDVVPD